MERQSSNNEEAKEVEEPEDIRPGRSPFGSAQNKRTGPTRRTHVCDWRLVTYAFSAASLRVNGPHVKIPPMLVESATIAANLERVRERIDRAAARGGRRAEEITLVAVTKTFPAEAIRAGYELGLRHFGENRVQEWESKRASLVDLDATWHLVGHLQSNKARRAAQIFHEIDSVDKVEVAQKLARIIAESGQHRLSVLIEVRLSPEETKTGAPEADLPHLAEAILAEQRLDLRGLMTIPPFFDDPERTRPYFRRLCEQRDSLRRHLSSAASAHTEVGATGTDRSEESLLPELSMGMSHDFEIAIEEGATQIRLGTALFGQRQLK